MPGGETLLTRRLDYNERLKKIIPANDIVLFDQWKYTALPRIEDVFCDEIHFSPKGYDIFADYIYDNIKSSVQSYAQSSNL
jgi:lysophospholipase L1-like esterase